MADADDTTKDPDVEEVVADESQQPETVEADQVEEVVEEQSEEAPQEESEIEAPENERPPSRREQLRIQQLLRKYGDPTQQQHVPSQRQDALDYQQALDADPEVIRKLEVDRQREGQMQYAQGQNEAVRRAEYLNWHTSLKIDVPKIEQKYPILDKNSTEFHPAVADALNTLYLKMSGFDPATKTVANTDISYADFVESNMELVEEIAGQKNAQTVKNLAQQTARTGLRPDGSSAPRLNLDKDPKEMTMEELYASIGQKNPHKK